jgi:hypothetical protein
MFTTFHARWVAAGLAVLALPLHAQQRSADDARADVPAIRYQAAYEYKTAPLDASTPDRHWRTANRTVADSAPEHAHHGHQADPAPAANKEPAPPAQDHHHHGEHH